MGAVVRVTLVGQQLDLPAERCQGIVLAMNLPGRRVAARSPSATGRGNGSLAIARISRPARRGGRVLVLRACRVLRRTPRRAGRTVANSTTDAATATTIAARGQVIGVVGAPLRSRAGR